VCTPDGVKNWVWWQRTGLTCCPTKAGWNGRFCKKHACRPLPAQRINLGGVLLVEAAPENWVECQKYGRLNSPKWMLCEKCACWPLPVRRTSTGSVVLVRRCVHISAS
jgi:hypothetical protein